MKIEFCFGDTQFGVLVEQWVEKARKLLEDTITGHPFDGNKIDISGLEIKVKVGWKDETTGSMKATSINSNNFPMVDLWLEEHHFLGQTEQEGQFNTENFSEEGFKELILHEFAHMFDERSSVFNPDGQLQNRKISLMKSSQRIYRVFLALWNIYIDGRLSRGDESKLQERIQEFEAVQKIKNAETLCKMWHGTNLTYEHLIEQARALVDLSRISSTD